MNQQEIEDIDTYPYAYFSDRYRLHTAQHFCAYCYIQFGPPDQLNTGPETLAEWLDRLDEERRLEAEAAAEGGPQRWYGGRQVEGQDSVERSRPGTSSWLLVSFGSRGDEVRGCALLDVKTLAAFVAQTYTTRREALSGGLNSTDLKDRSIRARTSPASKAQPTVELALALDQNAKS